MIKFLAIPLVASLLTLSACGNTAAIRQAAIDTIQAWNEAGVDPFQWPPERVAAAQSTCALAVALLTIWNPRVPTTPQSVIDFCDVVAAALRKAETDAGGV